MAIGIVSKINKSAPVRFSATDLISGTSLVVPAPQTITVDRGVALVEVPGSDCNGRKITLLRYEGEIKPKVTFTFARTPHILALKFNKLLTSIAGPTTTPIFQSDFIVPPNGVVAAKPVGTYGYGLAADTAAISAQYLDDNGAIQTMTQSTPYSSFSASGTPNGFAIGANFAMLFGNNLWGRPVAFRIPSPVTTYQTFTTNSLVNLQLAVALIMADGTLQTLRFDSASVDTTGAINLGEATQEVSFFSANDPVVEYVPLLNYC